MIFGGRESRTGNLVWHVAEIGMGATLFVEIDDATGAVLAKGRHSTR